MSARFVGRRAELTRLAQWVDESRAGRGRLVTVVGEAGIGKTRLMAEIAEISTARGCRVLWSQMIEDLVAPPYLPWLLALRACVQHADDETLRADLGSGAAYVADILPELRDRLDLTASHPPRDHDAARFQLFDSVTRLLLAQSRRQPLVLLFDNLHLADRSSLALLEYYARQLTDSASLVVAAHRNSATAWEHPLKDSLARLSRTAGLERVELGGLAREDVAELLHEALQVAPTPALIDAVHTRGDGNPLFTCQVASDLARRGITTAAATQDGRLEIPDSLAEMIDARLAGVGPEVVDVLSVAAVIGRDFDIPLLAQLCSKGGAAVAARINAAIDAGIVLPLRPGHFRFEHALFREVLYGRHTAATRMRLHRDAAAALGRRAEGNGSLPAAQLAYHWFEASRSGYRPEAIEWCRKAATEADERRAFGEAALQLARALQIAEVADTPDASLRFDLLSALGEAHFLAGQLSHSDQAWLKAALLAHGQHWVSRLAEAVLSWQYVRATTGITHLAAVPLHLAALERLPVDAEAMRARLLASLSLAYRHRTDPERARATVAESIELARQVDDPEVLFACLIKSFYILSRAYDAPEQLPMLEEALVLAQQTGNDEDITQAMAAVLFPLLKLGRFAELRQRLSALTDRAEATRHHVYRQLAAGFHAKIAILEGRWSGAFELAGASLRQAALEGVSGFEGRFAFQMFGIQQALGQLGNVAPLLERIATSGDSARTWLPGRILLHCELGQQQAARRALDRFGDFECLLDDDLYETSLAFLTDACVYLGHRPRCRQLYERLQPYRGFNLSLAGTLVHGAASGYMALLAASLERDADARALFEEALAFNAGMGSPPLLARVQLDYAGLLRDSKHADDQARARQLLAEARAVAESLGMRKLLQRIDVLSGSADRRARLTRRELAVLALIASGASNKHIAAELHLSGATVATHVRNILRKTATRNRTEAVAHARRCALLRSD